MLVNFIVLSLQISLPIKSDICKDCFRIWLTDSMALFVDSWVNLFSMKKEVHIFDNF